MAFLRSLYGEYVFIVIVLIIGIASSLGIGWTYQRNINIDTIKSFETAANDRIALISNIMDYNDVVLRSVKAFYASSDDISKQEFKTFTTQLLQDHDYILSLEWVPQVKREDRARYEAEARQHYPDFTFTEKGANGALIPAGDRDEYFPVYDMAPLEQNTNLLGYDLNSDKDRGETLKKAREKRNIQVSSLLTLLQNQLNDRAGVIFASPIYKMAPGIDREGNSFSYEKLDGFVISVVALSKVIENALKPLQYAGVNIIIHDMSASSPEGRLLYAHSTRLKNTPNEQIIADYKEGRVMSRKATLDVGGHKWEVTVQQAKGYYPTSIQKESVLISLVSILFTLLLSFYMLSRIRENERISREVIDRTHDLFSAKKRIETILVSTHEGIIGLATDGTITFCNPRSQLLLGYNKNELIGHHYHPLIRSADAEGTDLSKEDCSLGQSLRNGQTTTRSDEVFWRKDKTPLTVEYTTSPLIEDDEVTGAVLVFRDITERKQFEKQLQFMARHDSLTGLSNRMLFEEHLRKSLLRAERSSKKVAVIYLDLNGFKPVNDTLGHAAGDHLLKIFANRLQSVIRQYDTAARIGGDEFAIIADNLGEKNECLRIIERLQVELDKTMEIEGHDIKIGASIGISFYPDDASDMDTLISRADAAMYKSKKDKSRAYYMAGE